MSILDKIIEHKQREVELAKQSCSLSVLKQESLYSRKTVSLKKSFSSQRYCLIAEHKRKSPSKGIINDAVSLEEVVAGYENAGAAAISVLTDNNFFAGSLEDLALARKTTTLPILRKDFMIDSYQVHEAKAYGADLILLIARVLSPQQYADIAGTAKDLGLECLLEIHSEEELSGLDLDLIDFLGVNNRNLESFETSIQHSIDIASKLPKDIFKISESGIYTAEDAKSLLEASYQGFLIGESFMREAVPGQACHDFLAQI